MARSATFTSLALAALLTVSATAPVRAQPVDTIAVKHTPLFTKKDALIAGAFAVATVALTPLDRRIALKLQNPSTQANRFFSNTATDFRLIAEPGSLVIGGSLYIVGRLGHFDRVADLGLHGTESIILATITTDLIKGVAGRARPFLVGDTLPRDFALFRGFRKGSGYSSFPSGHTVAAFAAAAAVTSETSRWWPKSTWVIAPVMFGGATMVGLSRMYNNRHWGSDVMMGAAIGTFSGLKIVRYHHTHPGNRLDKWLLSMQAVPDGQGGARLGWVVATR